MIARLLRAITACAARQEEALYTEYVGAAGDGEAAGTEPLAGPSLPPSAAERAGIARRSVQLPHNIKSGVLCDTPACEMAQAILRRDSV